MASYDVIGSIAILKFPAKTSRKEKIKTAWKLLKEQKNIKTILEKTEKVKGRLRTIKTRFLAGIKTKETVHKENGCIFRLNVEKCYFSPRLSNERLEIAKQVKKKDSCLVMFAGVFPYPIVIAKLSGCKVTGIELGKECCKYARENIEINKLADKIKIIQGDVKKIVPKLARLGKKFDVVVMPRPQLKESFLKEAFSVSKKGTRIFYYDFNGDAGKILKRVYLESKKAGKKISVLKVKKAGEVAPFKFRWRVDLRVVS